MLEQEKAFNKQQFSLEKSIAEFNADKRDYTATLEKLVKSIRDHNKKLVKLTVEKQAIEKVLEANKDQRWGSSVRSHAGITAHDWGWY